LGRDAKGTTEHECIVTLERKSLDITYGLINMKGHKTHIFLHAYDLLGLCVELQKATISFVMSVYLSIIMKKLYSHRTDFHELRYWIIS